ncbi:MAG: hypothetical protein JWL89_215 [Candidatus Saccharibacteria bacterium]|nr:hypothetical protein [Candidatus Saccharibacteria bacterium]
MTIRYSNDKTTTSAKRKVSVAALAGLVVLVLGGYFVSWNLAPLLAWDVAALTYIAWIWATIWPMSSQLTASHAVREDPSRTVADATVLAASVASLVAVGVVLVSASNSEGAVKFLQALLGVVSVVVAWITVHTLFTLRYAELYYHDKPGGVDFPDTPHPLYKDFVYLAFTIGMTFQVSDTSLQTTVFRRTALRQALISYLFGTVIVATTINLIAGLTQ